MEEKTVMAVGAVLVAGIVGVFLKSAWDVSKEQAEEAANPTYRWTDKNRWE